MPKARMLLAAMALALAGCGGDAPASPDQYPLAGADIGGPFELVNTDGETVRWEDFDGQYRMVYFGYAYCPDVCPFDVRRMALGYEQWAAENPALASEVQPIFITIDPERDTPEVVADFLSNFPGDIVGLTGTPEQIDQAAQAFSVFYSRGEESEGGGYLMDHSRAAFLMGRQGEPIALLPVESSAEGVAEELDRWVS